jgi:hypothetical protein
MERHRNEQSSYSTPAVIFGIQPSRLFVTITGMRSAIPSTAASFHQTASAFTQWQSLFPLHLTEDIPCGLEQRRAILCDRSNHAMERTTGSFDSLLSMKFHSRPAARPSSAVAHLVLDQSTMRREIRESDWKVFRQVHPVAVNRFCEKVFGDITSIASDVTKTPLERYRAIYQLLRERGRILGDAFDDMRRSTALLRLSVIHSHGLLTEKEMGRFSPEARDAFTLCERI